VMIAGFGFRGVRLNFLGAGHEKSWGSGGCLADCLAS
jgi:hypothetical protein